MRTGTFIVDPQGATVELDLFQDEVQVDGFPQTISTVTEFTVPGRRRYVLTARLNDVVIAERTFRVLPWTVPDAIVLELEAIDLGAAVSAIEAGVDGGGDPAVLAVALGLGKLVAVGYGGNPTWIDPAAADWAAVEANGLKWAQFDYVASDPVVTFGLGAVAVMSVTPIGGTYGGADTAFGGLTFSTRDHWDGAGGNSGASVNLAAGGSSDAVVSVQASPDAGSVYVKPNAGQTDPMLDLNSIFSVAPDGAVGGVAPSPGDHLEWDGSKIVWAAP